MWTRFLISPLCLQLIEGRTPVAIQAFLDEFDPFPPVVALRAGDYSPDLRLLDIQDFPEPDIQDFPEPEELRDLPEDRFDEERSDEERSDEERSDEEREPMKTQRPAGVQRLVQMFEKGPEKAEAPQRPSPAVKAGLVRARVQATEQSPIEKIRDAFEEIDSEECRHVIGRQGVRSLDCMKACQGMAEGDYEDEQLGDYGQFLSESCRYLDFSTTDGVARAFARGIAETGKDTPSIAEGDLGLARLFGSESMLELEEKEDLYGLVVNYVFGYYQGSKIWSMMGDELFVSTPALCLMACEELRDCYSWTWGSPALNNFLGSPLDRPYLKRGDLFRFSCVLKTKREVFDSFDLVLNGNPRQNIDIDVCPPEQTVRCFAQSWRGEVAPVEGNENAYTIKRPDTVFSTSAEQLCRPCLDGAHRCVTHSAGHLTGLKGLRSGPLLETCGKENDPFSNPQLAVEQALEELQNPAGTHEAVIQAVRELAIPFPAAVGAGLASYAQQRQETPIADLASTDNDGPAVMGLKGVLRDEQDETALQILGTKIEEPALGGGTCPLEPSAPQLPSTYCEEIDPEDPNRAIPSPESIQEAHEYPMTFTIENLEKHTMSSALSPEAKKEVEEVTESLKKKNSRKALLAAPFALLAFLPALSLLGNWNPANGGEFITPDISLPDAPLPDLPDAPAPGGVLPVDPGPGPETPNIDPAPVPELQTPDAELPPAAPPAAPPVDPPAAIDPGMPAAPPVPPDTGPAAPIDTPPDNSLIPPPDFGDDNDNGNHHVAIVAGASVGGLALLAIGGGGAYFLKKRRDKRTLDAEFLHDDLRGPFGDDEGPVEQALIPQDEDFVS